MCAHPGHCAARGCLLDLINGLSRAEAISADFLLYVTSDAVVTVNNPLWGGDGGSYSWTIHTKFSFYFILMMTISFIIRI